VESGRLRIGRQPIAVKPDDDAIRTRRVIQYATA